MDYPIPSGVIISQATAKKIASYLRGKDVGKVTFVEMQVWADALDKLTIGEQIVRIVTDTPWDETPPLILAAVADWLERQRLAPSPTPHGREKRVNDYTHTWIEESSLQSKRRQRDHDISLLRRESRDHAGDDTTDQ
jgi:hypothetical protein